MQSQYYRTSPIRFKLYSPPTQAYAAAYQIAQKQYEENENLADALLKASYFQALPADRQRATEIQKGYAKRIDDVTKAYDGDFSQATAQLHALRRDMLRDFSPQGEAGAIASNYNVYSDWLTRHNERVKTSKILGDDLETAQNYFLSTFSGTQYDASTGKYNTFNPEDLVDYASPMEAMEKARAAVPEEEFEESYTTFQNGLQTDVKTKRKGKTAQKLSQEYNLALATNPNISSYHSQKFRFMGIDDPESAAQVYLQTAANEKALADSYLNTVDDRQSRRDPLTLLQIEEAGRNYRTRMQEEGKFLRAKQFQEETSPLLSPHYDTTESAQKFGASLSNWKTVAHIGPGRRRDPILAPGRGVYPDGTASKFSQFISSPKAKALGVNFLLFDRVAEEKFKAENKEGNWASLTEQQKRDFYDKNEAALTGAYDKAATSIKTRIGTFYPVDTESSKSLTPRILAAAASGSTAVWTIDDNGNRKMATTLAGAAKDLDIVETEVMANGKPLTFVDGFVTPGSGHPFAGYRVPTSKGNLYIAATDARVFDESKDMANAFAPIYTQGKSTGHFFQTPIGLLKPRVNYTFNQDGTANVENTFLNENGNEVVIPLRDNQGNIYYNEDGKTPLTRTYTLEDLNQDKFGPLFRTPHVGYDPMRMSKYKYELYLNSENDR